METTLENKLDIDLHTATSEQVYNEVGRIWQELAKLFGRENNGKLPFIALSDESGVEFYPKPPVETAYKIGADARIHPGSWYIPAHQECL